MTFGQFLLIWFGIGFVELLMCVCGFIYGLAIVGKRFDHSDAQIDRFVDLIGESFEKYYLPKGHLTNAWGVFHWARDILFAPVSIPFAVSRAIAPVAIGMLENFEYDLTVEPVRVKDFKRVVDEVATEVYKDVTVSEGYDEEGEVDGDGSDDAAWCDGTALHGDEA